MVHSRKSCRLIGLLLVQGLKTQNVVLKNACCAQGDVAVCIYVYVHVCVYVIPIHYFKQYGWQF